MALIRLPSYSPELNTVERLWGELREKEFADRVFDSLGPAIAQDAKGMKRLEECSEYLRFFNWMALDIFIILIATCNKKCN